MVAVAVSATVAATAGVTAVPTGCSQMIEADQDMAKISSVIALKTVLDVAVDYSVSKKFGLDFDPVMSGLISLGANIISSADPVNVVTGSFFLTATDMMLPGLIEEEFQLQRIYNSVVPCRGSIGKNWMLALESRLFLREEDGLIDAICMDGHVERFVLQNGEWKNRRQGDARYQLKKIPEGFVLIYIPEQKQYHYNSMGRLMFVQGKGQT